MAHPNLTVTERAALFLNLSALNALTRSEGTLRASSGVGTDCLDLCCVSRSREPFHPDSQVSPSPEEVRMLGHPALRTKRNTVHKMLVVKDFQKTASCSSHLYKMW